MAWTKVHCNLSPNQHLESRGWFRKSFLRRANFSLYDPMMSTCPNEWILDQYILFILYLNSNINKIYIFIVDKDEDFSWLKITRKTWSPGKLNQRVMFKMWCCCYWPPVCEVSPNCEVVEFQPHILPTPNLGYVYYWYVAYLLGPPHPLLLSSDVPPPHVLPSVLVPHGAIHLRSRCDILIIITILFLTTYKLGRFCQGWSYYWTGFKISIWYVPKI